MEIRIEETKSLETISLIDPKTNCCWIQDAIGNCDDLNWNEETEEYEMSQECFDWWKEYAEGKEDADNKYYELMQELDNDQQEKLRDMVDYATSQINGMEYEDSAIISALEEYKRDNA